MISVFYFNGTPVAIPNGWDRVIVAGETWRRIRRWDNGKEASSWVRVL